MPKSFSPKRLLVMVAILLIAAGAIGWQAGLFHWPVAPSTGATPTGALPPQNSLLVISPYRYGGTWVFDDARMGLVQEPFVAGIPEMIDILVADIPDADKGFRLTFSAQPFPDYQKHLTWVRGDGVGNWYQLDDPPMEGWICPALFHYFQEAPKDLYVKADAAHD